MAQRYALLFLGLASPAMLVCSWFPGFVAELCFVLLVMAFPAALIALERLAIRPDLLLIDGQGRAHPRRMGLACHLGLLSHIPAIGVAKSRLVGTHESLPEIRGSQAPLLHKGEVIGVVLRTRTHVKPIYVSIGHRVSLETAVAYTMACTPKYRLPETTRQAHRLASGK